GLELGARGGVSGARLEEPVPPGEELAELDQRLEVYWIEAPRAPVDEAAPGQGRAVHNLEFLPAERNRARPLDRLATVLPGPVVKPRDRPPDRPGCHGGPVGTDEGARDRGGPGAPARDLRGRWGSKRAPGYHHRKGLEEWRFGLTGRAALYAERPS